MSTLITDTTGSYRPESRPAVPPTGGRASATGPLARAFPFAERVPNRAAFRWSVAAVPAYMIVMNLGSAGIARAIGYQRSIGMLFALSMSPGYGARRAHGILIALGARGRLADAVTLAIFDVAFPLIYGLALSRGLRLVGDRLGWSGRTRRTAGLLPALAVAANWLADVCILSLIVAFPDNIGSLAVAASALTAIKFAVMGACAVWLLTSMMLLASRRRSANAGAPRSLLPMDPP